MPHSREILKTVLKRSSISIALWQRRVCTGCCFSGHTHDAVSTSSLHRGTAWRAEPQCFTRSLPVMGHTGNFSLAGIGPLNSRWTKKVEIHKEANQRVWWVSRIGILNDQKCRLDKHDCKEEHIPAWDGVWPAGLTVSESLQLGERWHEQLGTFVKKPGSFFAKGNLLWDVRVCPLKKEELKWENAGNGGNCKRLKELVFCPEGR